MMSRNWVIEEYDPDLDDVDLPQHPQHEEES